MSRNWDVGFGHHHAPILDHARIIPANRDLELGANGVGYLGGMEMDNVPDAVIGDA